MKRTPFVVLLVPLLLSCSTTPPSTQQHPPSPEATVRLLEEQERRGVLHRDVAALEQVWSKQLIVNAPTGQISADRSVVLNLIRQGKIHYSLFERAIELLRVDGDMALVMGRETIQANGTALQPTQTVQRRFTHVWRKEGGAWHLVARHANSIAPP